MFIYFLKGFLFPCPLGGQNPSRIGFLVYHIGLPVLLTIPAIYVLNSNEFALKKKKKKKTQTHTNIDTYIHINKRQQSRKHRHHNNIRTKLYTKTNYNNYINKDMTIKQRHDNTAME